MKFDREAIIEALIKDHLNSIETMDSKEKIAFVDEMLRVGFSGFENYTDQELREAYNEAGIEPAIEKE